MVILHPRDYTLGFGAFIQGKFGGTGSGGIDLKIRPIKGTHSDVAVHGMYKGPSFSSEFDAEFYLEHEKALQFLFHLKTPKSDGNPFGEKGVKINREGLTRVIGEVREEVSENGESHHYSVQCKIKKDPRQAGNMNDVYQELLQHLVRRQLGLVSGQIRLNY